MKLYRHRQNYWSCSRFAAWILSLVDVVKPYAETSEGWDNWNAKTAQQHPLIYNMVEDWLDKIQDIVMYPYDVYDYLNTRLRMRFIKQHYLIDTGLDKWEWQDTQDRMLHGLFSLLVDFVELEKTNMQRWNPEYPKIKRGTRSREHGLAYLEWEMTLEYENHYTRQAIAAKNVYDLYIWWKDVRPNRPDPYEISGWSAFCDRREASSGMFRFDNMDDDERKLSKQYREKLDAIQESYEDEDEEMMIKLIKIRQDLWT